MEKSIIFDALCPDKSRCGLAMKMFLQCNEVVIENTNDVSDKLLRRLCVPRIIWKFKN